VSATDDQHLLEFEFQHSTDDTPRVPASVLIQTLEGAQRALWLIAMSRQKGGVVRSRARIPAKIEQAFQLQCEIPKSGSYVMPTAVLPNQPFLEGFDTATVVVDVFERIAGALTSGAKATVLELLPDASFRRRVIDCFRSLAPRAGSGWRLKLLSGNNTFQFDDSFHASIRRTFQVEAEEATTQVVNGELTRIDFANHKIAMIVLGSEIEVECSYEEPLEDFLYEKRRDLIQVTGRVVLNDQGLIKQMIEVESITELDLSPVEIVHFNVGSQRLVFRSPLTLAPVLDPDTKQHILLEHPQLGIHVFAPSVPLLMEELVEQLAALWVGYAEHPDQELTPGALELKHALTAAIQKESP
jgi:hypothetical protein